jgi:hypothetical protein
MNPMNSAGQTCVYSTTAVVMQQQCSLASVSTAATVVLLVLAVVAVAVIAGVAVKSCGLQSTRRTRKDQHSGVMTASTAVIR